MERRSGRRPLIERLLRPFQEFTQLGSSSGILLLTCAVVAFVWAHSPLASTYFRLWQTMLSIGFGPFALSKPLLLWINDVMAVFFFVVGLEIKREILVGELNTRQRVALPIAAALGGALLPAAIYMAFTAGREGARGWGIPMATDIAFALGVLSLLGERVPAALKVFLTALAIVDDLVAVLVIAFFYTAEIAWTSLGVGALIIVLLIGANVAGVRHPIAYALLGIGLWLAFLKSGVHATVAGVLVAMTIPARAHVSVEEFLAASRSLLREFERSDASRSDALHALESLCERVSSPLARLEHVLHPWVAFGIMPVFALANAGVALESAWSHAVKSPITLGIVFGLILGKQVGILLFSWLAVKSRLAVLPEGVGWRHIYGVGWLGGIGFTMSLFIATLAFDDPALLNSAKVGVLMGSAIAGILGGAIIRGISR